MNVKLFTVVVHITVSPVNCDLFMESSSLELPNLDRMSAKNQFRNPLKPMFSKANYFLERENKKGFLALSFYKSSS